MKLILTSDTHYGIDGKTHAAHEKFWRRMAKTIEKENVRALIWAGDLASTRQRNLARTIQHAREHVKIPILLVRGNHDWWDGLDPHDDSAYRRQFSLLNQQHQVLFGKYDVVHLEDGPYVIDDVIFCGWDGWYGAPPQTNDARFMFNDVEGCPMHVFMSNRAWRKFDEVMLVDVEKYRAAVAVTHHNPYMEDLAYSDMCANLKFFEMIKEKFDVFCCGHSHKAKDRVEDECRVLNAGAEYNGPKFVLFEV